ncbi:quinone oxidoreductase family protein [Brevibacterium samyangense]|uniref:Zinc-binding dehydrogenase n=1 Tax=Brevibacterium samyangense TaxID=366888 RepID=A0ABP5EVA9_9MICO
MRAVRLREHGSPEVLAVEEVAAPVADASGTRTADGRVLVDLRTAGLNRRDALLREGIPGYRPALPFVLGSDGAGVRRDTGEEVVVSPALRWGTDRRHPTAKFGLLGTNPDDGGTYAETIAVPEANLVPKPRHLTWAEAGVIALSGMTAYRALFTVGRLAKGKSVVVLGAGSGVSTIAVQLAVHAGAKVAVTSSSEDKIALAKDLGATCGVLYTDEDWDVALHQEIGGADLVLDSVGSTLQESVNLLRPGGAVVSMGGTGGGGHVTDFDIRTLYLSHKRILGTAMGAPQDLRDYMDVVATGAIDPVVDSVYALEDVAEAHTQLDSALRYGKIALEIG